MRNYEAELRDRAESAWKQKSDALDASALQSLGSQEAAPGKVGSWLSALTTESPSTATAAETEAPGTPSTAAVAEGSRSPPEENRAPAAPEREEATPSPVPSPLPVLPLPVPAKGTKSAESASNNPILPPVLIPPLPPMPVPAMVQEPERPVSPSLPEYIPVGVEKTPPRDESGQDRMSDYR